MGDNQDFDIFETLWTSINDICAPPPPPGKPAKACFLMELPGFTVDPKNFDPETFDPSTMLSPGCSVATLCDRIPALASYFYDTGERISSTYKIFMETFTIETTPQQHEESEDLKERYDEAIKMLYGDQQGYIKQTKTPLFENLDKLHKKWEEAQAAKEEFRNNCREDKKDWPGNYERGVGPYVEAWKQAYTAYENLKQVIEKCQAAIHAYNTGDLTTVIQEQATRECMHRTASV